MRLVLLLPVSAKLLGLCKFGLEDAVVFLVGLLPETAGDDATFDRGFLSTVLVVD